MIGLDTNVLLRLVVADDAAQTEAARNLVSERCTAERPAFVNLIVLCELAWTLNRTYGFGFREIAIAFQAILNNPVLSVEAPDHVAAALKHMHTGGAEFADLVIREINRCHGCEATATFDRKAARLDGFKLVR